MAENNNTSLAKRGGEAGQALAVPFKKDPLSDFFANQDEIQNDEFSYENGREKDADNSKYGMDLQEYLLFTLNDERYAIELTRISEIIKISQITKVPHTPYYVAGIISLRGNIVPVYRLSRILHLDHEQDSSNRTLVVDTGDGEAIGFIVDKIHHVVRFSSDQIEPPPATLASGAGREFITGIGWEDGQMIIMLDLDSVVEGHI